MFPLCQKTYICLKAYFNYSTHNELRRLFVARCFCTICQPWERLQIPWALFTHKGNCENHGIFNVIILELPQSYTETWIIGNQACFCLKRCVIIQSFLPGQFPVYKMNSFMPKFRTCKKWKWIIHVLQDPNLVITVLQMSWHRQVLSQRWEQC